MARLLVFDAGVMIEDYKLYKVNQWELVNDAHGMGRIQPGIKNGAQHLWKIVWQDLVSLNRHLAQGFSFSITQSKTLSSQPGLPQAVSASAPQTRGWMFSAVGLSGES